MTIEELRPLLNISPDDSKYDEKIEKLYDLAKRIFYQYTRVRLSSSAFTDNLYDFSDNCIFLYNTPVTQITSIQSLDSSTEIYKDIEVGYVLIDNIVYLDSILQARFLKVNYVAGYNVIPSEIDSILVQVIDFLFNYDATKTFLSTNGELLLGPNDVVLPKVVRDNMAMYRVGM